MRNSRLIVILIFLILVPALCVGTTHYLDAVKGDDADPGTSLRPWKTIARAYSTDSRTPKVQPGDTVYLTDGSYAAFDLRNYSNTDWITYQAAPGRSPVFTSIYIYNSTKSDVYLKFDGIDVEQPDPGLDPDDPPWPQTIAVDIIRSNHIEIKNAAIKGWSRYLTTHGVRADESGYVTVDHCEIYDILIGITSYSCNNFTARWCHIHDFCVSGIQAQGGNTVNNILIEGNHLHKSTFNQSDDYYPPDILDLDPVIYPLGSPPAFQVGEEIWQPSTGQPTAKGRVMVIKWETDRYKVYLQMITTSGTFRSNIECKSKTTQITFTPTRAYEGHHLGSALSIRTSNTTIRKNVLHDFLGQGIMFYGGFTGGHSNMVVENNLLYDITNGNNFENINGPFMLRNNTIIGALRQDGLSNSNILWRYDSWSIVGFYTGYDGRDCKIYNNIVVGWYIFPAVTYAHDANNNITWSHYPGFDRDVKGSSTSLLGTWSISGTLHGYPNLFEDIGFRGSTPEYNYASDGVQPFFVSPGYRTNPFFGFTSDMGKIWDYRLADGSPGINFGDPNNQPSDSLGTIGPDGFIRNDGPSRDASHHSAGCYEYVTFQKPDEPERYETEFKCYNNVFNPTKGERALIRVQLQKKTHLKLSLYNAAGKKIKELADEEKEAGTPHKYYWDGKDDNGNIVGSGLYFVHIEAGDYKKTKKIVVVK